MAFKEKALRRMSEKLNAAGVTWAIGAGFLLTARGVLEDYHDIDIVVAQKDAQKADKVLSRLGLRQEVPDTKNFRCHYHFDGADVDMGAGLAFGDFEMDLTEGDIAERLHLNDMELPVMYLEDWLVIYSLLPGKDMRVRQLLTHLEQRGCASPERFDTPLGRQLPGQLRDELEGILKK